MLEFTAKDGSIIFMVRVVPRASKSEIAGEYDGTLKVRLSAPPVDGAANKELIRFLSKTFGLAKSEVVIIGGETARAKRLKIYGIVTKQFLEKIN